MLRILIVSVALVLSSLGVAAGLAPSADQPAGGRASPIDMQPWVDWHEQMLQRALSNPAVEARVSVQRYNAAKQAGDLRNMRRAMVEIDTIGTEAADRVVAYTAQEYKEQIRQARIEGDKESLFDLLTNRVRDVEVIYKPDEAERLLDEAEGIARSLQSPARLAKIHFERGWRHFYLNRKADATREFNAALAMAERPIEVAQVLLAQLPLVRATTNARASVEELVKRMEEVIPIDDYPTLGVTTATELGTVLALEGDLEAAEKQHRLALGRARKFEGNRYASTVHGLAGVLIDRGKFDEAERLLDSGDWSKDSSSWQFHTLVMRIKLHAARKGPRALALLPQAEKLLPSF